MKRFLIVLSLLWATSASAQFTTTTNYGFKKPNSGLGNSWDAYLNGDFDLLDTLLGSGATTAGATYNVGDLACVTATNTVGSCGSAAANLTFIGVLLAKNGVRPVWTQLGVVQVNSNATASFVAGDIVCSDPTNGGKVIDNGALPCGGSTTEVGVSIVSDGNVLSHAIVMSQGTTGGSTGALPTMSASTTGQQLTNTGSAAAWSAPSRDCTQFSGADMSLKIVACLAALKTANATGGVADARAFSGTMNWSVNPFASAGANKPTSGILLLPCGLITIQYGPVVVPSWWSMKGCSPTFGNGSGIGTNLRAGATFPNSGTGQYTTGTVTMGSQGSAEIITGSGTTWTDNVATAGSGTIAPGCQFISPSTQPVVSASTFGIITSITDTTHVVLGYGANNTTGAPGGSTYKIYCPLVTMSDGSEVGQAAYSMTVTDMELDANGIAGVIPLVDWFGQQSSYGANLSLRNMCGVGLDLEGQFFYQSGPWHHILTNPGSCDDGTSPDIVVRPNGSSFYGLQDVGVFNGAGTNPTTGIDIEGFGTIEVTGVDSEGPTNGVTVGGAFACKPACVQINRAGLQVVANIDNVFQSLNTSAVHLSNAAGINPNVILSNINGSGATDVLIDDNNSCTIPTATESRLGSYQTDSSGKLNYSTSKVAGCFPPVPATYTFFCTGAITPSSTIIPFPFNSTATTTCTATGTIAAEFPLANNCTLKNLAVHAGTGGVTGDVVTVINNGGATTIVAAIGTGTSASDTTHTSAYVAGNGLRVAITAGVASTLANVTGSFQCN